MRGRFALSRCCCDCVPCPFCETGLASKRIWIHTYQNDTNFEGPLELVQTSECRWESTDDYLPRQGVLVLSTDAAQLLITNDNEVEVAIWDYAAASPGDAVNCGYFPEAFWTCREDTGTIPCDPNATIAVQPYVITDVEAWEAEYVLITDQDGNVIQGAAANRCEQGIQCTGCPSGVAPETMWIVLDGYVDTDANWSVLNGVWEMPFGMTGIVDPPCIYYSERIDTGWTQGPPWDRAIPTYIKAELNHFLPLNREGVTITVDRKAEFGVQVPSETFVLEGDVGTVLPSDCYTYNGLVIPLLGHENQPNATATLYSFQPPVAAQGGPSAPTALRRSMARTPGLPADARWMTCPTCGSQKAMLYSVCRRTNDHVLRCSECGHRELIPGT